MRRTLLIVALALPLLSACASGGGMRPRYDPAAGQTNLEETILQTAGASTDAAPMRLVARYSWRGEGAPSPAPHAYINVDAYPGAGWQWRENNQLQVTVDGQRARYNGRYSNDTEGGRRHESVTYQIPITDLQVMANATRVEGRIGSREFTMGRGELEKLRAFVTYISGGTQR